jgi:formiminotetrahydrofolate cyclodeaminase
MTAHTSTSLTERSVRELLAAFRASDPAPGGGSAAALAGAVGAALLAMVAGLPRPRATSAPDVDRLTTAGREAARLSEELTTLVDRDSDAYKAVMAAYKLPKGSESETRARSALIQEAMMEATVVPLEVMRTCAAALEQAPAVGTLGNANASSDVQVAIELLKAARRGARLNVEINLEGLKDVSFAVVTRREIDRLMTDD